MVAFFERHTALEFSDGNAIADIHGATPGAGTGGRSVCAAPYDARALGPLFPLLRKPMPETAFLGSPIMAGSGFLAAFMSATRSLKSFAHVARRLSRHMCRPRAAPARDAARQRQRARGAPRPLGGRSRRRALGFVARKEPHRRGRRGARRPRRDAVGCGRRARSAATILAAGGYPHTSRAGAATFGYGDAAGHCHFSVAPPSASGDGLRLGEAAGGVVDTSLAAAGAWCPGLARALCERQRRDFPHIVERGKPGIIGVLGTASASSTRRTVITTTSPRCCAPSRRGGSRFLSRLLRAPFSAATASASRWPVPAAGRALHPFRLHQDRRSRSGRSARACGIDPAGLEATVEEFNRYARNGRGSRLRPRFDAVQPQAGRSGVEAEPLRRPPRSRARSTR